MKAVIMAGGQGVRLRPLTCDLPKPMAPLCGRPALEYVIELLAKHGVQEAAVTVGYLAERIIEAFPENCYAGVKLHFFEETTPLGTAGSVKNACKEWKDQPVLVMSGDALCDFDLTSAMEFHRKKQADATLLVKRVEDPREYGLVCMEEGGRITGFLEKPGFSQAVSDYANTGIYLLSPGVLEQIPTDKPYDFAKDLFPKMLAKEQNLRALEDTGYWCDIGDLDAYARCQQDMLAGKVRCRLDGERDAQGNIFRGGRPAGSYTVLPPVYLSSHVTIGEGAVLDRCIVDEGCAIGSGARVRRSVLLKDVQLSAHASVTGGVLCCKSAVEQKAAVLEGAALGSGAVVGAKAVVQQGIKIWPGKRVEEAAIVRDHLRYGSASRSYFGEQGITGEIGIELTPEFAARLGQALGTAAQKSACAMVGLGWDGSPAARMLADAVMSGISASGAQALNFGACWEGLFGFAMGYCDLSTGVLISGREQGCLRISGQGGLPLTREQERELEQILTRGEFLRARESNCLPPVEMGGVRALYAMELLRCAPGGLSGMEVELSCQNQALRQLGQQVLKDLGTGEGEEYRLKLPATGEWFSLYHRDTGWLSKYQTMALTALTHWKRGKDTALPYEAPRFLDDLAQKHGRRLLRYLDCPAGTEDYAARKMARQQFWVRDGLMGAIRLLGFLQEEEISLKALTEELPEFAIEERVFATRENPAGILRAMGGGEREQPGEGILVRQPDAVLLLRPDRKGKKLKLMVQAAKAEVAAELCGRLTRMFGDNPLDTGENKV